MRGVALSTSDTIVLTYCQALRRGGEGLGGRFWAWERGYIVLNKQNDGNDAFPT